MLDEAEGLSDDQLPAYNAVLWGWGISSALSVLTETAPGSRRFAVAGLLNFPVLLASARHHFRWAREQAAANRSAGARPCWSRELARRRPRRALPSPSTTSARRPRSSSARRPDAPLGDHSTATGCCRPARGARRAARRDLLRRGTQRRGLPGAAGRSRRRRARGRPTTPGATSIGPISRPPSRPRTSPAAGRRSRGWGSTCGHAAARRRPRPGRPRRPPRGRPPLLLAGRERSRRGRRARAAAVPLARRRRQLRPARPRARCARRSPGGPSRSTRPHSSPPSRPSSSGWRRRRPPRGRPPPRAARLAWRRAAGGPPRSRRRGGGGRRTLGFPLRGGRRSRPRQRRGSSPARTELDPRTWSG